jgi:hypothetical protein
LRLSARNSAQRFQPDETGTIFSVTNFPDSSH